MAFENPVEKVFSVELLREMILDYTILDGNEISTANLRSCRLVSNDWLLSTSRCLRKSNKPLVKLGIGRRTDGSNTEDKMTLNNFMSTFTGASHMALEQQVPPFTLSVDPAFFYFEENKEILLEFLSSCGSSLIDLNVTIKMDSTHMFSLSSLSLPTLRSFTVEYSPLFMDQTLSEVHQEKDIPFIQQVLNGCTQLQDLHLRAIVCVERLVLPISIRELTLIGCPLKKERLELLTRNKLPNLKKVHVVDLGMANTLSDGFVFKKFEKFQATLTHISVEGSHWAATPREITYFDLPVFKNLELLYLTSRLGERLCLHSKGSSLERKLPKLRKLVLEEQTEMVLRNWVENSRLTTVKCLQVSIVADNDRVGNNTVSFRWDMMQGVNLAFPNLTSLEITVCGTELCGLKYAFQNLKQLQFLAVNVDKTKRIINSDYWDALLTGIPMELVTALRTTGYWNDISFKEKENNSIASIKKLTELKELILVNFDFDREPSLLISDAVFQFAFHQMAKLTKLTLMGRFEASSEAVSEWEAKGHKIRRSRWIPYRSDVSLAAA